MEKTNREILDIWLLIEALAQRSVLSSFITKMIHNAIDWAARRLYIFLVCYDQFENLAKAILRTLNPILIMCVCSNICGNKYRQIKL